MGLLTKLFGSSNQNEPKITVTISGSETLSTNKREFSDGDPSLTNSLNTTESYKPAQKLPLTDICPYCGATQDKPIGRKKACPACKKPIFVRTTQDLFPTSALTTEQVAHVDFYTVLKNILMATREDYNKHEQMLKKKWNTSKVNTYDVLWSMFNDMQLLQRNIDKGQEEKWTVIQMLRNHHSTTLGAAQYQAARGHNPAPYLKNAFNIYLKVAKMEDNVRGLTVQCYSCCDACTKFHNKTFSLDFIEKTPVLPIKTCTHPFEDGSKFVFCTCSYREYYEWQ